MAVYKTVDPDESKGRVKRYTGVSPEYETRLGVDLEHSPEYKASKKGSKHEKSAEVETHQKRVETETHGGSTPPQVPEVPGRKTPDTPQA